MLRLLRVKSISCDCPEKMPVDSNDRCFKYFSSFRISPEVAGFCPTLRLVYVIACSKASTDQFIFNVLNNLTSDYDPQLALMERRVGDADKPLSVEEVRGELNLRFKRLNMKISRN
jgi:hypothetical protein